MAEEQVLEQSVETEKNVASDVTDRLQQSFFGDIFPKNDATEGAQKSAATNVAATTETTQKDEEEIVDVNEWLKREFETDDVAILKQEREELKKLREAPKTFEYKNDESKKVAEYINEGKWKELNNHFNTQEKLEKLSKADLATDIKSATELVKFGIQKDNELAKLSQDEIEFLYNERYGLPVKPEQSDLETDDEYAYKLNAWEQQVKNIEKKLVIEAKIQQPKMAQLNTELVLPEIKKQGSNEPTKEQQEAISTIRRVQEAFVNTAPQVLNDFKGFSAQVKDKDVDYTVSYSPSQETKNLIDTKLADFVEQNLSVNAIFSDRWVDKTTGNLNANQMIKDLSMIFEGEAMLQKMAVDSGNKRLEAYLKGKKQVDLSNTKQQGTFVPNAPKSDQEALTSAWLKM